MIPGLREYSSVNNPDFYIGELAIHGKVILAPMDGFTDHPFRKIARGFGSAVCYTEFINAIDVVNHHPLLDQRLYFSDEERPVAFQLFDNDPERLEKAAIILSERDPDILDINLSCPTRRVAGRGAGAGLLLEPAKIATIFSTLTKKVKIPITAKIRLGWDPNNRNYLLVSRIIEENGGRMIAVHARTRSQSYDINADWESIAEIKQNVSIPVVGNGDVFHVADIDKMIKLTGCDAVMIGRSAVGNPWIFSGIEREYVPLQDITTLMQVHHNAMQSFYGFELGAMLFKKHAVKYLQVFPITKDQCRELITTKNDLFILLDQFLKNNTCIGTIKPLFMMK